MPDPVGANSRGEYAGALAGRNTTAPSTGAMEPAGSEPAQGHTHPEMAKGDSGEAKLPLGDLLTLSRGSLPFLLGAGCPEDGCSQSLRF